MKPTYNGYQLKVMRDPHPTNPLDMWDAPIKTFTTDMLVGATSAEQHLIYALTQEASRFGDYLYDHHLQWGRYYDIADLVPVSVDWHLLSGCHLDTPPDMLVGAIYNHLRNNVYHIETLDMERCTVVMWAEREGMSAWSGNPMDNIKDFVSEYRACIDGDVWGYTLTPALYDNDNELVEVDPDPEEQDSCFGFYGTQANCITHALPAFAADSLIAHCGEWLEECTINIFEVPDGTGV